MATYTSFEQLDCWKKCRDVKLWTKGIIGKFPTHETYELAFSIKKCARSSTRNIAEGFGKYKIPDKVNFCRMSKGSLHELIDDILTALDEGYITREEYSYGRERIEEALKSINGYISYLNSRNKDGWEPM